MGINSTRGFHRESPVDLMKELTICETLASPASPHAQSLGIKKGYGALLGDFLASRGLLGPFSTVLELGGGYGTLMHGLLASHGHLIQKAIMMDLSPMLLRRQRTRLQEFRDRVSFIQADIHELKGAGGRLDLIIINEVIGDLDVTCNLDPSDLPEEVAWLVKTYGLETPDAGPFNFNTGALRLVETLCRLGVPAFLSEHSSDPIIPVAMPYLGEGLCRDAFPREIRLHGHSEYTIRFSHLVKVAQALGRTVHTGSSFELLGLQGDPSWRFIFMNRACATDRQELVYEFLDHVREYRWITIS